ncbi:MAG: LysM peptidoglycan-binding domain-containing protein [Candidatus Marinimicrobia bacterium]|nr:LysM peptidoglycan-binding domain-containing protein [Candidatus Neomarinimicrobiota bacterium]MCF7850418.1 LysM peptidoglycan-binding domain-containing protein [Candidatus Neomarinimicrobiota bacterium]MCF7905013.1 LysM peptidoglycan-binding domain-containing protein [Candidatus Neomarinimicrobiota bacterium]
MSYSIRNSIILAIILLLLGGGGYGWLHFTFDKKNESLTSKVENKEQRLAELEKAMADYEYFREELYKVKTQFDYYPKLLPPESAIQGTYRYLDKLSTRRASFNYDFRFDGIKRENGSIKATYLLTGEGDFDNIANFIYRLENGKPIYKIQNLSFKKKSPRGFQQSDNVEVSMQLTGLFSDREEQSDEEISRMFDKSLIFPGMRLKILQESQHTKLQYHKVRPGETLKKISRTYFGTTTKWRDIYDLNRSKLKTPHMIYVGQRLKIKEEQIDDYFMIHEVKPGETLRSLAEQYLGDENLWRDVYKWNQDRIENQIPDDILTTYDPFKPLILSKLPPNVDGLVNVAGSRLVALTNNLAFILDQEGVMQEMKVGDKVYLGNLSRIDLHRGKVLFNLNKGGIFSTEELTLANSGRN